MGWLERVIEVPEPMVKVGIEGTYDTVLSQLAVNPPVLLPFPEEPCPNMIYSGEERSTDALFSETVSALL